jgi:murein DD-endopeptidase MepM/ murein hydrolase activator NlpD
VIGRTDMGVDANLKPGAPIRAIGNSRVVNIYPNWYRGQPYVLLQLLDGPQKGKFYYVAEQIAPNVRPGQKVKAGQPIGTYASSGTGIEIGWGTPGSQTLAQATGRDNASQGDHANTPAGINFRSFLGGLK